MPQQEGLLGLLQAKRNPPAVPQTSFEGKTVLITGSNTGLGFYAAQHFVRLGVSQLILGVRNISKGEAARAELEKSAGRCRIAVLPLDMTSFASVKAFAEQTEKDYKYIDLAILNAGLYNLQYKSSPEGWEETIQVNTLSTTLLALLLLPSLRATKQANPTSTPHLVLVSSGLHATVSPSFPSPLDHILSSFSAPPPPNTSFKGDRQYATSKLLLMYALKPLASLATSPGGEPQVIVTSCCPGFCVSGLARDFPWYKTLLLWVLYAIFGRSTEEGSRTLVSAGTLGDEAQGGYWKNDELMRPGEMVTSAEGKEIGKQVWSEIVNVLKEKAPEVGDLVGGQA